MKGVSKKALSVILAACTAALLASCGSSDSSSSAAPKKNASGAKDFADSLAATLESSADSSSAPEKKDAPAYDGSTYDTGVITVAEPKGWKVCDVPDSLDKYDGDTDPNAVYVIKGGESSDDVLHKPYLWIVHYDNPGKWSSSKAFYDNVKDLDPVTIGTREWTGFSFSSLDTPGLTIKTDSDGDLWVCNMVCENGDDKISLEDKDVQDILATLKVN